MKGLCKAYERPAVPRPPNIPSSVGAAFEAAVVLAVLVRAVALDAAFEACRTMGHIHESYIRVIYVIAWGLLGRHTIPTTATQVMQRKPTSRT